MNPVMAMTFHESCVLTSPILACSHFLKQFKCHLLGNNVFLNRQFGIFLPVKRTSLFCCLYGSLITLLSPTLHSWACTSLYESCGDPFYLFTFTLFLGFVQILCGMVSFHYLHLFFPFFCPLQKKACSTVLLASSAGFT